MTGKKLWFTAAVLALSAKAFIRNTTNSGTPLFRRDAAAIQLLVNGSLKAGETNSNGNIVITPASSPMTAIASAAAEWSAIATSSVVFAPPQPTALSNNPNDGIFVLTIEDTPENRSIVGSYLAITFWQYNNDGTITDSDIIFNPHVVESGRVVALSTDQETATYDMQSLVAHELGHSLGAAHSPLLGVTMFQSQAEFSQFNSVAEVTLHQNLSVDDVAFATSAYPNGNASAQFGSITGTVAFSNGSPVLGALVVAVDAAQGASIGGISSLQNGTYRLDAVPPGTYVVYAQPANGPVMTSNLAGLPNLANANTHFRITFAGGNAAPSAIPVSAGVSSAANISVDPATSAMRIAFLGTGSPGGSDWAYIAGPKAVTSGQATELYLWGPGLDSTITAGQIRLLGPSLSLRPSTVRIDPTAQSQGFSPLRFTVDVAPSVSTSVASVAVVKGTDAAAYSGGLVILGQAATPASVAPLGVSPSAGTASSQTIAFTFFDPAGWQDLGVVNILMNNFLDGRRACYLAYSQPSNVLYLVDDNGATLLPGARLNASGSTSNSQCAVSWNSSAVNGSGNILSLTLTFAFNSSFAGNKVINTAARDAAGNNSGWQPLGVWQVPGAAQTTATAVSGMMPPHGAGTRPAKYTFFFSDTKGYQDIGVVNVLVNGFLDGRHACYLAYSRPANVLYLVNDNGDGLLPGQSLAAPGSVSNSQCAVAWSATAVNASGNNLNLTLNISFTTAFSGNRVTYLAARDANEGNNTGWQSMGN